MLRFTAGVGTWRSGGFATERLRIIKAPSGEQPVKALRTQQFVIMSWTILRTEVSSFMSPTIAWINEVSRARAFRRPAPPLPKGTLQRCKQDLVRPAHPFISVTTQHAPFPVKLRVDTSSNPPPHLCLHPGVTSLCTVERIDPHHAFAPHCQRRLASASDAAAQHGPERPHPQYAATAPLS